LRSLLQALRHSRAAFPIAVVRRGATSALAALLGEGVEDPRSVAVSLSRSSERW